VLQLDTMDPQFERIEDERERREAWHRLISPVFVPHIDRSVPFPRDVSFRRYNLERLLISSMRASAQTIERTQAQVATQAIDHVVLRLYASEISSVTARSGKQAIKPGSFVLFDLCNAAFTPTSNSAHNHEAVAAIAMRQFIEEHLENPDLGIETIAARFGTSRTPIYALFEGEGGVMTYIRNRRLARAMRILSGVEGGGPQRVSTIAYACGYESPKMFSRAFHRRYGVNPRDVDAGFRGLAHREEGTKLLSWIKDL
jgi:AraC-like DNA-binding protein